MSFPNRETSNSKDDKESERPSSWAILDIRSAISYFPGR